MLMFDVMIVEDEPMVARFIQQLVAGIEGLHILKTCGTAEEACKYITEKTPQILVTDIRMRGMSGLELIRYAKQIKPDIQVVIISGYGLFEYAKEAMKLGIADYLLKPIDPDELTRSLKSLHYALIQEYNDRRNQRLKRLLVQERFERIRDLYNCEQVNLLMVCQSGDPESTLELCISGISALENGRVNAVIWNHAVLIVEPLIQGESQSSSLQKLERWLWNHRETNTFNSLISRTPVAVEALGNILPAFYRSLRKERVLGCQIRQSFPLAKPADGNRPVEIPATMLTRNPEVLKKAYELLFAKWEQEKWTIWQVRAGIFVLLDDLRQFYPISDQFPVITEKIAENLRFSDSFEEAMHSTWKVLETVIQKESLERNDVRINLELLYQEVARYIQRNCHKNDSLQEIAKRFHVSQPYISRAFRIYARMSYKEYCMHQKIEMAKKIISAQQDVLFKDVAAKVGIEQSYFSTVFHRMTGMYPSEYKASQEREA